MIHLIKLIFTNVGRIDNVVSDLAFKHFLGVFFKNAFFLYS